jgi:sugar phosphate isomerase/epimerase
MDAVELRTTHKHGVEVSLPPAARAEVRKRFADSPVKIGGLGTTCEYHAAESAVVRKNIDETKEWVKLASDVGAPSVKVRPNGLPKDVPEEKTLEQIGKSLRECGVFAQDHGVRIQLEVHGTDTSRLPRIRRILDYGGNHPAVRVCWNSNPTDLLDGGLESTFGLVKDQIGQVHMRDLFVDYPWRALLSALAKMNFQGYCLAEIPESADPVRVLNYFRALFRAYQGL